VDLEQISKSFNANLKMVVHNYKGGVQEFKDLVQFMHFIICRHIVQRKHLDLIDYTLDDKKHTLHARTVKKDLKPLMKEYLKDIDYSPFYYQLWGESDPVTIPPIEEVNGKKLTELGKILNSDPTYLENIAQNKDNQVLYLKNNKVYFKKNRYSDFRDWTNNFNDLFTEAGNLAVFIFENGYEYDVNNDSDLGTIIMAIYKDTEKVYHKLLSSKDEVKNLPSEMKEVMSFIYMVTAARTFVVKDRVD
jgi:hypothetical protein